jgi:hypothetical protein
MTETAAQKKKHEYDENLRIELVVTTFTRIKDHVSPPAPSPLLPCRTHSLSSPFSLVAHSPGSVIRVMSVCL